MDRARNIQSVFNACAKQYQDRFMDNHLYDEIFDLFCSLVQNSGARILDVGCGPGNISRYLIEKRPDFIVTGIDFSENMIALARQNNPAATYSLMDARQIVTLNTQFDGIICGFCLPYFSKEEALQWIEDAAMLLKTGGVLYISTMEDDYAKSGMERSSSGGLEALHIFYHQADYLTQAFKKNGFNLKKLQRIKYTGQNGKVITDLVMVSVKQKIFLTVPLAATKQITYSCHKKEMKK